MWPDGQVVIWSICTVTGLFRLSVAVTLPPMGISPSLKGWKKLTTCAVQLVELERLLKLTGMDEPGAEGNDKDPCPEMVETAPNATLVDWPLPKFTTPDVAWTEARGTLTLTGLGGVPPPPFPPPPPPP